MPLLNHTVACLSLVLGGLIAAGPVPGAFAETLSGSGQGAEEPVLDEDGLLGEGDLVFAPSDLDAQVLAPGRERPECDIDTAIEAYGAETVHIDAGLLLHLVPCNVADVNIPYYVVMEDAGKFSLISFTHPVKDQGGDPAILVNATWDVETESLTSFTFYSPDQDCGIFEQHHFSPSETRFHITEVREKEACDALQEPPEDYPLVNIQ